MDERVADCERALVAHWSQLGGLPGGRLHEPPGLVWFETPVGHLPYNGVLRTRLTETDADEAIARVVGHLRRRGAHLFWVVHPSAEPADLGDRLAAAGLVPVEQMHFMTLDLDGWSPPELRAAETAVGIAEGERDYEDYSALTCAYWEIPPDERPAVAALHRAFHPGRNAGHRFLARLDGTAVGKAYLSMPGPPGVASIYGMSVLPAARGRGVAQRLTAALLARAAASGCHRVALHATEMAVALYARAGFAECARAPVYATAPLWADGPSG